jgi:protein disulfide-isomerase A1
MGWCSRRQSSLRLCAIEFCSCNVVAPIAALVFFLAVASAENIYKKSKVFHATDKNFDKLIASNDYVLVNYCIPNIGRCKALNPEFKRAATELESYKPRVQFAQMNVDKYDQFAERVGIISHPTLKWYEHGKFHSDYDGGRTKDRIVDWVVQQTKVNFVRIDTKDNLYTFKVMYGLAVVGLFRNEKSDEEALKQFDKAAREVDIPFGLSSEPNLVNAFLEGTGVEKESSDEESSGRSVYLYRRDFVGKDKIQRYPVQKSLESLGKWVVDNRLPLVVHYAQDISIQIYQAGTKFRLFVLCDRAKDVGVVRAMEDAALLDRGKVTFITVSREEYRLLTYLNSTVSDFPSAHLVTMKNHVNYYYKYGGKSFEDAGAYSGFIQKAMGGELKPHLF